MSLEPLPDAPARPEDAAEYRRALGAFATGVCVVTADTEGGPLGITINSFTSVSLTPRLVLWCLDEKSERWGAFATAERFAIHVLASDQQALSKRFAKGISRLEADEATLTPGEPPKLTGVAARFDCRTHKRFQMGDHMIVVGEVEGFEAADAPTLTYFRGAYGIAGGE